LICDQMDFQLDEVAEKAPGEMASARRCPDGERMHISDRLGLREEAEQISDDPGSVTDDERRVSKLMDQERVVQVTSIQADSDGLRGHQLRQRFYPLG